MLNLLPSTALWRPCRLFHAPTDAESSQTYTSFLREPAKHLKMEDVDAEHFKHFDSKGASYYLDCNSIIFFRILIKHLRVRVCV